MSVLEQHKITVTKSTWEFEGSHGRSSEHTKGVVTCSCGFKEELLYYTPSSLERVVEKHEREVTRRLIGLSIDVVDK